jgi:hypothetical protein
LTQKSPLLCLLFAPEDALQTAHKTTLERKRSGEKLKTIPFSPVELWSGVNPSSFSALPRIPSQKH